MPRKQIARFALGAALAAFTIFPATAQKSKDTLRVAVSTTIPMLSIYEFAQPDADFFYRELYDNLELYNEDTQKFEPRLAKSYKQIDPTTIEFELRDDVTWHNGDKFDADDVAYTFNWTVAPDTKMFLQNRYTGVIKNAEKTGPHTVRLHTVAPTAIDMLRLRSFLVLDSKVHSKLEDKTEYGRKGIGTGPMQLAEFQPGQKIVMTKFPGFKLGKPNEIGRMEGYVIPDQQTQMAQLLTGGVDLVRNPTQDQINDFTARPGFAASVAGGTEILYITVDALNRSGEAKPLTDVRVRKAMAMAIDREALIKNIGFKGMDTHPLEAMCSPVQIACAYTVKSPGYNPQEAKKLLAEAGYEKGFPLTIATRPFSKVWGEALVGELRKVGIEATLNPQTDVVLRKDRSAGKLAASIETMPILALPDAHLMYQINYAQPTEDYSGNPEIGKLGQAGLLTQDIDKRKQIYTQLFNLVNEQVYIIPITVLPSTYLHSAEVVYRQTPGFKFSPRLTDFHWK
jgi:peptide/nickel transport system substrate-binding protein